MKSTVSLLIALLLTGSVLLASFGSVSAIWDIEPTVTNPTVTPVSGDLVFTTALIPTANLPGTTSLASGMLIPVGFTAGEKQFDGSGVLVSGFDSGKARACFPVSGTPQGWGGKVGMWNGSKWVLLPTTITTPAESTFSWACATITGNGYYAFIKWVADPAKLPTNSAACGFQIERVYTSFGDFYIEYFEFYSTTDLSGMYVTVSLNSIVQAPVGSLIINDPMRGTLVSEGDNWYLLTLPGDGASYSWIGNIRSEEWKLDFGSCVDFVTSSKFD